MSEQYAYMDCRDLRHAWERSDDEFTVDRVRRVREFTRVLVCSRCGTMRRDDFTVTLQRGHNLITRVGARYKYARGYQIKGGIKIDEMRWDLFNRVLKLTKR